MNLKNKRERVSAKGTLNTKGLKVRIDKLCSKINSNIKEKIIGPVLWEPIPMFSGVSNRAKAKKRKIVPVFLGKQVETM